MRDINFEEANENIGTTIWGDSSKSDEVTDVDAELEKDDDTIADDDDEDDDDSIAEDDDPAGDVELDK